MIVPNFASVNLLLKPYWLINITKILVAFKLKSGIENTAGGIKVGENDQPKELSNTNDGFIHDDNEGENFDDGKHCKTLSVVSMSSNERQSQNKTFTFHRIKNVSQANGRNVKQPKAQKTTKTSCQRVKWAHR